MTSGASDAIPAISSHDDDRGEDSARIGAMLGAEVAERFRPREETPLSILAHDAAGALVGGLNGSTHWGWLYIRQFWVAEGERGRGLGRRLLSEAEAKARARGCVGVYLDTFSPEATAFYEQCGFLRVGAIENFPPGHARTFLRKGLASIPPA